MARRGHRLFQRRMHSRHEDIATARDTLHDGFRVDAADIAVVDVVHAQQHKRWPGCLTRLMHLLIDVLHGAKI
jgi:hypothetical protein